MNIITKELNSIKKRISTFVLAVAAKYKLPGIAAFIIGRNVLELQKSHYQDERGINILFFPKTGFNEDIMASFGGIKEYGLYSLERIFSKTVFIKFIPGGVDTNNYLSKDPFIEKKKEELRFFWIHTTPQNPNTFSSTSSSSASVVFTTSVSRTDFSHKSPSRICCFT